MHKLVYVSDDYDHLANLIAQFLRLRTDWETVAMRDGAEVLAEAQLRRPDICILDIDMPGNGGVQAAQELRMMFPTDRPLLVGILGVVPHGVVSDLFDHVFSQPLDVEALVKRLT